MEEGLDAKKPLLLGNEDQKSYDKLPRVTRRYSVNSILGDFSSRLPDKLRCGLNPEDPFNINLSKTKWLNQGNHLFLSLFFCILFQFCCVPLFLWKMTNWGWSKDILCRTLHYFCFEWLFFYFLQRNLWCMFNAQWKTKWLYVRRIRMKAFASLDFYF